MCADADDQLFAKVTRNAQHLLHDLLPPLREQHYSLRERSHNCCLPDRVSTLMDNNFLIRMLYKDFSCLTLHSFSLQRSIISHVFVLFVRNRFVPVDVYICFFFLPSCISLLSGCGMSTFIKLMID